jgi:hypothetical protein
MKSKDQLRKIFSEALLEAIIRRYKFIPSAAFIAKEFNIRANILQSISHESARRWLQGSSLPDIGKLLVLRSWLDLDLNSLGMPSVESVMNRESQYIKINYYIDNEKIFEATQSVKNSINSLLEEINKMERQQTQEK